MEVGHEVVGFGLYRKGVGVVIGHWFFVILCLLGNYKVIERLSMLQGEHGSYAQVMR